jgi:hypothetical protein
MNGTSKTEERRSNVEGISAVVVGRRSYLKQVRATNLQKADLPIQQSTKELEMNSKAIQVMGLMLSSSHAQSPQAERKRSKRFQPVDDQLLKTLVKRHPSDSWALIASHFPGRTQRQCRERWKHHMSGERYQEPWTPEEESMLWQKFEEFGPKWTRLANFFDGRTDLELKVKWTSLYEHRRQSCFRLRFALPPSDVNSAIDSVPSHFIAVTDDVNQPDPVPGPEMLSGAPSSQLEEVPKSLTKNTDLFEGNPFLGWNPFSMDQLGDYYDC